MRILTFVILSIFTISSPSFGFLGLKIGAKSAAKVFSKADDVLPESKIGEFVDMIKDKKGLDKVGKILSDMNLSKNALEDTYMRIIVKQNKGVSFDEANSMFRNLSGIRGFRETLRKVSGDNPYGTRGHLSELRLASKAADNGFDVVAIGDKFDDGIKSRLTDIDLIIKRKNITVAIENKDYDDVKLFNLINFRNDMETLAVYKNVQNEKIFPVLRITNKPTDPDIVKQLNHDAKQRNVEIIYGDDDSAIIQITQLAAIVGKQ